MKSFLEYLAETGAITPMPKSDVERALDIFTDSLDAIRDDYAKCLAVMNFINNQDGSVSELILAELLNRHSSKIKSVLSAKQVGGSQSLTDIEIDVGGTKLNISLKTSKGNNSIKLGYDSRAKSDSHITKSMMESSTEEIASKYGQRYQIEMTCNDIIMDKTISKETKDAVKRRISAIAKKICGLDDKGNKEVFCWIEKNSKKIIFGSEPTEILTSIRIRTYNFNIEEVISYLMKCQIYLSKSSKSPKPSWGIKNEHGDRLVTADNTMMLNVTKDFLNAVAADKDHFKLTKTFANTQPIEIFDIKDQKTISKLANMKMNINQNFIDSLLKIYNDLTK